MFFRPAKLMSRALACLQRLQKRCSLLSSKALGSLRFEQLRVNS
jgi:hypothetical protein